MLDSPIAQAILLGVVEGLTEFLPVSSTGHLILAGWLLGFDGPPGKVFEVAIQLGAIVAVSILYFRRLWRVAAALPTSPAARRFALALLLGFLPAMVLGALFHGFIKGVLFSPWVVVTSLVLGGVAILLIERARPNASIARAEDIPLGRALAVGFCQALAMIPGVSRSGATILGGVLLGLERRAAAEFSFFLAIPTMLAATVYNLYKNQALLTLADVEIILVGFVSAMLTAMIVVEGLLRWLQRHTFEVFGWYRIAVGLIMAIVLLRAS